MRPRTAEETEELVARITAEGPLSFGKAAKLVPASVRKRDGGTRSSISATTIRRWVFQGIDGVRLEAVRLNADSGFFTSAAAVRRFQAELTRRALHPAETASRETPTAYMRRAEAAGRELDRELGIVD